MSKKKKSVLKCAVENKDTPACTFVDEPKAWTEEEINHILNRYSKHPDLKKLIKKIFDEYEILSIVYDLAGDCGINHWRYSFKYKCKETGAFFTCKHEWLT